MSGIQDSGYKLLFSHPEMVRDLLKGFVAGEWLVDADLDTLQPFSGSLISDSALQRHEDMVWRVRVQGRWLWVYIALEFQSSPDPWMAVRVMAYTALLAQHLIRAGELHEGLLPPVLPIVLYNGLPPWKAPIDVADCYTRAPPGLDPYRPRLVYYLIDEARLNLHPTQSVRNFSEALFRLEQGRTVSDVRRVLQTLDRMLREPALDSLRRAFGVWVKSLLRRKAPASSLEEINQINDIMEADSMLAERIEGWFDDAWKRGMQKGIEEGRQEGLQQGLQQGEAMVLSRILTLRFGNLPSWVHERLAAASRQELETWVDLALSAESLHAVFSGGQELA